MKTLSESQAPSDPLMRIAWVEGLHWAIGDDEVMDRFRQETGETWRPSTIGIENMIDEACGAPEAFMSKFIDWFNANIWGDLDIVAESNTDNQ